MQFFSYFFIAIFLATIISEANPYPSPEVGVVDNGHNRIVIHGDSLRIPANARKAGATRMVPEDKDVVVVPPAGIPPSSIENQVNNKPEEDESTTTPEEEEPLKKRRHHHHHKRRKHRKHPHYPQENEEPTATAPLDLDSSESKCKKNHFFHIRSEKCVPLRCPEVRDLDTGDCVDEETAVSRAGNYKHYGRSGSSWHQRSSAHRGFGRMGGWKGKKGRR